MQIYTGKTKKWHKPFMQTMSKREVNRAITLSACSFYHSQCATKSAKTN